MVSSQTRVLVLTSIASLMVALDALVVRTALRAIRTDLHASIAALEWTVNAYSLSFAVLLMTAAALRDRFGRRRLFAPGLFPFVVGSAGLAPSGLGWAACALARGTGWLIPARALPGVRAAFVMPLSLALLSAAFPP